MNRQDRETLKEFSEANQDMKWPTIESLQKNMDEIESGWPLAIDFDRETNPNYQDTDYGPPFLTKDLSIVGLTNLAELITGINRLEYSISKETLLYQAMKCIRPIVEANNYDDIWVAEIFYEFMNAIDWIQGIQLDFMTD